MSCLWCIAQIRNRVQNMSAGHHVMVAFSLHECSCRIWRGHIMTSVKEVILNPKGIRLSPRKTFRVQVSHWVGIISHSSRISSFTNTMLLNLSLLQDFTKCPIPGTWTACVQEIPLSYVERITEERSTAQTRSGKWYGSGRNYLLGIVCLRETLQSGGYSSEVSTKVHIWTIADIVKI